MYLGAFEVILIVQETHWRVTSIPHHFPREHFAGPSGTQQQHTLPRSSIVKGGIASILPNPVDQAGQTKGKSEENRIKQQGGPWNTVKPVEDEQT